MERTDLTIAIAGAGIVVLAMVGSAVMSATGAVSATYLVAFETNSISLPPLKGDVQASGEASFDVGFNALNATQLKFFVQVSAFSPHLASDDVVVIVTAPNGTEFKATASASAPVLMETPVIATLRVDVPLGRVPENRTVDAADSEEARRAADDGDATAGHGLWHVLVRLTHGGPEPTARHPIALDTSATTYSGHAVLSTAGAK